MMHDLIYPMNVVIAYKIREAIKNAENLGYVCENISPREFYDYLSGETYTGDIIALDSILQSELLMLHEVIEISELKRRRTPINRETIINCDREMIYDAHLTATEYEIRHALKENNLEWIRLRLSHAKMWLEDENLPKNLVEKCKQIIDWLLKLAEMSSFNGL